MMCGRNNVVAVEAEQFVDARCFDRYLPKDKQEAGLVFQTREIIYDYKICLGWGDAQRRQRRRRRLLAMAAPLAVALFAGMASDHLGNHEFHVPPFDSRLIESAPTAERVLPLNGVAASTRAYQNVLAELEPVSNPFMPHSVIAPAPRFPGSDEEDGATVTANLEPVAHVPAHADLGATSNLELVDVDDGNDGDWQVVKVRQGDSLSTIFARLGLSGTELDRILGLGGDTATLKTLRPDDSLRFRIEGGSLSEMVHEIDLAHTLHVRNTEGTYTAETVKEALETRVVHTTGVIRSSLFEAGQSAGLSDTAIMNMADIFDFDIDLVLDIRDGDRFHVVYEEVYKDGSKQKDGNILAAEFVNQGKAYRAVRYEDKSGSADYYRPDGSSLRRAFIRTPVAFSRITSKFGVRRHPVLNRIRAHKGVDYAAPTGTPIKATGDGRIAYAGWQGGYGRVVQIEHEGGYTTVYGHLSKFAGSAKVGQRVKLGQTIGYVGQSGLATGPHLHYEFRVGGVHRDPLKVKLPKAIPIPKQQLADFKAKTRQVVALLDDAVKAAPTTADAGQPAATSSVVASAAPTP
jgi:murein DD-endopeptidase MepM/ murein hydrolase activator NlpD